MYFKKKFHTDPFVTSFKRKKEAQTEGQLFSIFSVAPINDRYSLSWHGQHYTVFFLFVYKDCEETIIENLILR